MSVTYKVGTREGRGNDIFILGLRDAWGDIDGNIVEDTFLLFRYPAGDCDNPSSKEQLHRCLYDERQTNEHLNEGDKFDTKFGMFECVGIDVLTEEEVKQQSPEVCS